MTEKIELRYLRHIRNILIWVLVISILSILAGCIQFMDGLATGLGR